MRNIYFGDRGTLVTYVQLALIRAGYGIMLDGIFGVATCQALQEFLGTESCVVNEAAWNALEPYLKGYRVNAMGNVELFDFPLVSSEVEYSAYLTEQVVEGLNIRYPFVETGSIGSSVMDKPIYYLRIGRGSRQVCYNASFHANESITTPLLLRFAEEYADAYENGGRIGNVDAAELYENFSLYLIPLVNPDGVDLVNGILVNGPYYRQAMQIASGFPQIPFPSGWKANINGVDLNLQFPAGWENAKAIKYEQGYDRPAPRDFVGVAPLTAPESRAVYQFTTEHDFSLILAYHTQGRVIYWKYLNYEPEGSYEIARYFGEVSGYAVEETPSESGYAGYKDWFIMQYNRPGYTIEVGEGVNPLPLRQFAEIYSDNVGILVGGMTEIGKVEYFGK